MLKLKPESIRHAIIKTSTINLLARGFGYLKHLAIAILLGFSYQTDAFFMALSLLGIFLIFVDVFDSIGVPQLVFARMKSEEEFKKLAGLLLTFTTILAFSLTFIALVGIPLLSKIAVGFDQRAKEATELHLLLLLPYLFLNFFFHHFGAVLRSLRYFTPYFIGEFIFSFFSFLFITFGLYLFHSPLVLPISLSLSQLMATLYIIFVGKEFLHFSFFIDKRVKEILKHFVFLSALYGVFHLFILVDRAFASLLGEKGVSALTYGLLVAFVYEVF
jgi:putative peptidoglycan lipid II flippase